MVTAQLLEILRPKPCPYRLVRIGGLWDGAYLLPDDLRGVDACFSPGVYNTKRFEDDLAKRYGIRSHMCDFSSDEERFETPLIDGLQFFRKKWPDLPGSSDSITLDDWVNLDCSVEENDLILQMDIEGAEYRNLLHASAETLSRFRIIVLELHGLGVLKDDADAEMELGPVLRKLQKTHVCIHLHPNNNTSYFIHAETGMNVPVTVEATFLRIDRMSASNQKFYPPQLPNPSDISMNVWEKPPLHLNSKWLVRRHHFGMREAKIFQDHLVQRTRKSLILSKLKLFKLLRFPLNR